MIRIRNRQSTRLKRWDYRSPGYYFITVCVQERWKQPFGFIKNNMMCLSNIGTMANKYWIDIPKHFFNVTSDQFSKPIKNSLPMIINQYKSSVTRWSRMHNYDFQWQGRYYEHIIRSKMELYNVRQYIINNPRN